MQLRGGTRPPWCPPGNAISILSNGARRSISLCRRLGRPLHGDTEVRALLVLFDAAYDRLQALIALLHFVMDLLDEPDSTTDSPTHSPHSGTDGALTMPFSGVHVRRMLQEIFHVRDLVIRTEAGRIYGEDAEILRPWFACLSAALAVYENLTLEFRVSHKLYSLYGATISATLRREGAAMLLARREQALPSLDFEDAEAAHALQPFLQPMHDSMNRILVWRAQYLFGDLAPLERLPPSETPIALPGVPIGENHFETDQSQTTADLPPSLPPSPPGAPPPNTPIPTITPQTLL